LHLLGACYILQVDLQDLQMQAVHPALLVLGVLAGSLLDLQMQAALAVLVRQCLLHLASRCQV
jgi:hypothetical protein